LFVLVTATTDIYTLSLHDALPILESVTSATPTGCLAVAPALAEARGFFVSLAVDVVGTLLLREPGSAPKNFDQRTLLCGESTLPTPHHPLQRLPSHPLMPQPRRRLPTQLSQNSYRLTIPPHPRIRLRHIQAMPVPRV